MKKKRTKMFKHFNIKLGSKVKFFYTVANGNRIYTNEDANKEYKNNMIHDPKRSTYVNLFVNGVLQPQDLFSVSKGILIFNSENVPEEGTPIILQFVKLYVKKGKGKKIFIRLEE